MSNGRTSNFLLQIKMSFMYKIVGMVLSFLLVPLMIKYLGVEKYGLWAVVFGLVSWLTVFDFGLGNGLKNEITKTLANNDSKLLNKLIITGYITNFTIILLVLGIFLIVSNFINWSNLLNTSVSSQEELLYFVNLVFIIMSINFVVSLIMQIIHGYQKSSYTTFFQMVSNGFILILLYVLYKVDNSQSLIKIAILYGLSLIIINIVGSVWFFKTKTTVQFSLDYFDKALIKNFMNFGLKFFYLQIAVILIYQTDKIIISHLFGPEEVAKYDLIFKLFTIVLTAHTLVLTPLWSAMTDAYENKDKDWIYKTIKKINLFLVPLFIGIICIISYYETIIDLWIGKEINIDSNLVLFLGISFALMLWNNNYSYIMNGFGKLNLQLYTATFAMIVNIPLSLYLGQYFNSAYGVVIASVILQLIFVWLGPVYVYRLIRNIK
jgi:O-antigen/teichoic acid export membrane protein